MLKRIPVLPTIVVLIAVGIMVRLGFWQIDRMHQKEALLAQYEHALQNPSSYDIDNDYLVDGPPEYSRVKLTCPAPSGYSLIAGHNSKGETGWAHVFVCQVLGKTKGLGETDIVIGWSQAPVEVRWSGGEVSGTIVPNKRTKPIPNNGGQMGFEKVIADPPLAGLEANARPDPKDLPNNHWSYAIQWFLFAATALVIYGLALRKRLAAQ